jgi:hypothetical protein
MSGRPDVGLERLIQGLEQELLAAPDEEFLAGAQELGMNPQMKGSAAFLGVKNLNPQMLEALRRSYAQRADDTASEEEATRAEVGRPAKPNVDA